jgi:transposase
MRERGLRRTARELNVSLSSLKRWKKNARKIRELASRRGVDPIQRRNLVGGGRPSTIDNQLGEHLVNWIEEEREDTEKITVSMVVARLRLLDNSFIQVPRHHLRRRIWRILHQKGITLRKATHQAQINRIPQQELDDWIDYIKEKMEMLQIGSNAICNFDETNIYFSPDTAYTLNRRGARTIAVKRADSTQRCTVMIGVSGSGFKFPPLIIYKGSANANTGRILRTFQQIEREFERIGPDGEFQGYPLRNKYAVQANAWMDTPTMIQWVRQVYVPWAEEINGPNIVLLDLDPAHAKKEVTDLIAEYQGHVEHLPAHSTSFLQVMDVGLNKPFKDYTRDLYDIWFMGAGNNKPKRENVSSWIKDSWDRISERTIKRTWRHIGFSFDEVLDQEDNESMQLLDHGDNDSDFLELRSVSTGSDRDDYENDYENLEEDNRDNEQAFF